MDTALTILLIVFLFFFIVMILDHDERQQMETNQQSGTKAHTALNLIAKERPDDLHKFLCFDNRLNGEIIRLKKSQIELETLYKFPDNSGLRVREGFQGHGYRSFTPYNVLDKRTN